MVTSTEHTGGYLIAELALVIVIIGVVMSVAFTADSGQLQHVAQSFAETKASRLAASRLEELRDLDRFAQIGVSTFPIATPAASGLPGVQGSQAITAREPGLFEVRVEVSWLPPGGMTRRRVALTSLFDQEGPQ